MGREEQAYDLEQTATGDRFINALQQAAPSGFNFDRAVVQADLEAFIKKVVFQQM